MGADRGAALPALRPTADELCVTELASVIWAVQMSTVEFHPRPRLAFAREVERRAPQLVTTTWWRKDRDPLKVFVDYNQNARDHTIAAAYSVRGVSDARVSAPIRWDELDDVDPHDLTMATVPARVAAIGDVHADIDDHVFDIAPLLEWAERDEKEGQGPPDDEG